MTYKEILSSVDSSQQPPSDQPNIRGVEPLRADLPPQTYLPNGYEYLSAQAEEESEFDPLDPDSEPQERGKGGLGGVILGLGLGVLGTLAVLHFFGTQATQPTEEAQTPAAVVMPPSPAAVQTVTVAAAELATVRQTLNVTGTVEAYDLLRVLPQATGLQIQQVLVKQGDIVQTGQVMAVLDDSVLQAQIIQAQAEVESQRTVVRQREADVGRTRATVAQAEADVAQTQSTLAQKKARLAEAQANLDQANREVERYQRLSDEGAISRQELETRITQAKTAQEGVRVAEADISAAEAQIRSAQANINSTRASVEIAQANIRTAEANVRSSQARVQQLQTQLEQTVVRAPASGVVAERQARIGDVTNGTQELYTIIAENQLELHAKVPETQLSQVKIGAPVTITSDADPNLKVVGTVREVAPLINPESRKATVKIDLPPLGAIPGSFLRPGMFLKAAITTTTTQGLKIPAKAVVPQADGSSMVYRVTENEGVEAIPVEVGEIQGQFGGDLNNAKIEIKQGLRVGDRVVVSGAAYLKDGDKVNIVQVPRSK